MNKVAHYLQEHLTGEVLTSIDARRYFSTDTSIFSVTPAMVVYPRNENDVRKTARFTWQLAERGRVIPLTARGAGTDQSGGAIGSGILLVFPAHMNRLLELDGKSGSIAVEPGINYGKLQQTLHTHSRFLPPFPASAQFSTIGGAIANNASGEKTIKYGSTREYVDGLRVVLANGEVIETRRLSKRELNKKLGLATFEGEIYRQLDALIEENKETIDKLDMAVTKNAAGYALSQVKRRDGSFDLTPLLVGSQGTLGVVTEAILATEDYNPNTTLILAHLDDLNLAEEIVLELRKLPERPSAIEMVDDKLLDFVHENNPNQLKSIMKPPFPKVVLLIEFDNPSDRIQKKMTKKVVKILEKNQINYQVERDPVQRDEMWKVRHSASAIFTHTAGNTKAIPIIEDGVVPPEKLGDYIRAVYQLFERYNLRIAMWGHAGDGNIHMQPFMDLSQVGDRQKAFKLMDEYHKLVIEMGGSTTGEHNDGRLRGAYLQQLFGQHVYELFGKVKQIFDPYGTLNPGVKIGVKLDDLKPILRQEYSMDHLYDHLPRS